MVALDTIVRLECVAVKVLDAAGGGRDAGTIRIDPKLLGVKFCDDMA